MDIRVARLSRVSADNAPGHLPGSFFVLGEGECAHWAALALMACLREQGLRIAALMPLARDAQWRQGRWHSERVAQLQAASSFAFPATALCPWPQPDPSQGAAAQRHPPNPDELADSFAVLATWADLVVVDGAGDPEESLAPGLAIDDMVQALGLPVVVACENSDNARRQAKAAVTRCRERGIPVIGWVAAGEPLNCTLSAPCLGQIPAEELHDPARASRRIDASHLLGVLGVGAHVQGQARH
jgi:dethiobiotin synthetase